LLELRAPALDVGIEPPPPFSKKYTTHSASFASLSARGRRYCALRIGLVGDCTFQSAGGSKASGVPAVRAGAAVP
jgi:hypothetical protein